MWNVFGIALGCDVERLRRRMRQKASERTGHRMTDQPRQDVQSQEQEGVLERTLSSPAPRLATESISTAKAPTFRAPAEAASGPRALVFPGVGQRIDDFEIERVLGEGAFGKVYLARQVSLERHVGLKV